AATTIVERGNTSGHEAASSSTDVLLQPPMEHHDAPRASKRKRSADMETGEEVQEEQEQDSQELHDEPLLPTLKHMEQLQFAIGKECFLYPTGFVEGDRRLCDVLNQESVDVTRSSGSSSGKNGERGN
ncbi:unnamed protein product, partial [Amoebophrya sp. A25]